MSTAALKRELALLRSSLAALTPTESATLDDPVAWAEGIAGLTLETAPECDATERQEHSSGAESGLDRAAGWSYGGGLTVSAAIWLPVP